MPRCGPELIKTFLPQARKAIKDAINQVENDISIDIDTKNKNKEKLLKIFGKYDDGVLEKMKKEMQKQKAGGFDRRPSKFNRLCKLEREIIERIVEVAQKFHEFLDEKNDIEKRLRFLAEFGSGFTDTFNDELGHISFTPKGALRPLGLVLMSDIARILDPELDNVKLSAMLDLYVLKPRDFRK